MTCLKKLGVEGYYGTFNCNEKDCQVKTFRTIGATKTDYLPSELDCIELKKLEVEVKLIHKIEALIEGYLKEHMFEITHDLAIKIANDLLKEK